MPQRAETQGRSEEYMGRWIRSRNIPRDSVVLATKVSHIVWLLFIFCLLLITYSYWTSFSFVYFLQFLPQFSAIVVFLLCSGCSYLNFVLWSSTLLFLS